MGGQFYRYVDNRGEWRWTYKASNGEPIAVSSEGYKTLAACDHSIDLIKQDGPAAPKT